MSYGAGSDASAGRADGGAPTIQQLADRYSDHVRRHDRTHALHERYLRDFILPRFGQARIDQVRPYDVQSWLGEMLTDGSCDKATTLQLGAILSYMFRLAQRWSVPGAESSLLTKPGALTPHFERDQSLTPADIERLKQAAEASANPQLGAIVSLLMLTGVEPHHLLSATWDCIDEAKGEWTIPLSIAGATYRVKLSIVAIDVIRTLPRWDDCPYVIANPRTRKPYGSILGSWDTARKRAGLPDLSIHDLRYLSDIQGR